MKKVTFPSYKREKQLILLNICYILSRDCTLTNVLLILKMEKKTKEFQQVLHGTWEDEMTYIVLSQFCWTHQLLFCVITM